MGRPFDFTDATIREARIRQGGVCAHCGGNMNGVWEEAHHAVPNQSGIKGNPNHQGLKGKDNCVVLCGDCHYAAHDGGRTKLGAAMPPEYYPYSHGKDKHGRPNQAEHQKWLRRMRDLDRKVWGDRRARLKKGSLKKGGRAGRRGFTSRGMLKGMAAGAVAVLMGLLLRKLLEKIDEDYLDKRLKEFEPRVEFELELLEEDILAIQRSGRTAFAVVELDLMQEVFKEPEGHGIMTMQGPLYMEFVSVNVSDREHEVQGKEWRKPFALGGVSTFHHQQVFLSFELADPELEERIELLMALLAIRRALQTQGLSSEDVMNLTLDRMNLEWELGKGSGGTAGAPPEKKRVRLDQPRGGASGGPGGGEKSGGAQGYAPDPSTLAPKHLWGTVKTLPELECSGSPEFGTHCKQTFPPDAQRLYVCKPGDSLSAIAKRFYGDASQAGKIHDANRATVRHPSKWVYPGQSLLLP